MTVIPGKYANGDGDTVTVVALARHGLDKGEMVVYRSEDGELLALTLQEWEEQGFAYMAERELRDYLAGESRAELVRRFFDLFESRYGAYCVHWRSAVSGEGYNYACENYSLVSGCYRGIDSCKNCGRGRLSVLSPEAVDKHLRGEQTLGVYPVTPDGRCRFLVMGPMGPAQAKALRQTAERADLPCYTEARGKERRLWFFFSEPVPLPLLRRLGNAVVTLAMETSADVDFSMYDRFLPCRDEILPEDMGFELRLPFGGADKSVFVDSDGQPLPYGSAEIFRVRTLTRGYLADRLKALGDPGPGRLWSDTGIGGLPELPPELDVCFDGSLTVKKPLLSRRAILDLERKASVKAPERPFGQFEPLSPCLISGYSEDGELLKLPRGLRTELELMARASRTKLNFKDGLPRRERETFTLLRPVNDEQHRAAELLARRPEGILAASQGWGKTGAVARLIELKGARTLILTADENTRLRWVANIMEYLGVDTERSGAKVHVRLATDRRIKDKYELVILADCSRLPMNTEIFTRIRELTPRWLYGITASENRRDGLWGLIRLLCGDTLRP